MIYREAGQFKTSYASDQAIFPIAQDRAVVLLALAAAFDGPPLLATEYWLQAILIPLVIYSLAAIGLIIPTVFHLTAHSSPEGWSPLVEQKLSLAIAIVLFLTYFCMLGFSLRTHKHLYRGSGEDVEEKSTQWSRRKAIIILLIATAFVALLSEFLVGTIENVRDTVGLTDCTRCGSFNRPIHISQGGRIFNCSLSPRGRGQG